MDILNKKNKFLISDLSIVQTTNPDDIKFIKQGAKVWLRSGSPLLTVVSVNEDEEGVARVSWLNEDCPTISGKRIKLHTDFRVEMLTPEPTPIKT